MHFSWRIIYRLVTLLTTSLILLFHPGTWLNRSLATLTCAIFSASSICTTNFLGRAIAVQPDTPAFTSSVKQLDANHAEIRLTFFNRCEFVSYLTKTPEGIIQDSLQYSHNDLETCGVKPFIAHYLNAGKTLEIQIPEENSRLRLDASVNKGNIQLTYQHTSGEVQQRVTPIPKKFLDYLKESEKKALIERRLSNLPSSVNSQLKQVSRQPWLVASNNAETLYQPDSAIMAESFGCYAAERGASACNYMSMISGLSGLGYLFTGLSVSFGPILTGLILFTGIMCSVLYGGFPPIFGFYAVGLAAKLKSGNQALTRNLDAWGKLKETKIFKAFKEDLNLMNQELAKTSQGSAVIAIATGTDSYLDESKKIGILSKIIKGTLSDFVDDCRAKRKHNALLAQGYSTGDPHLNTFDGLRYDLQTVGEVILIKSNDGAFEVQARQAPLSPYLSVNSAVAMKVGRNRVALYAREFPDADINTPLRVDGTPTTIQGDKLPLTDGGEILKQGNTYVISSPIGEKVLVTPSGAGNNAFFNVASFVYKQPGIYNGLLGNVNGNPNDDLQIRGGGNVLEVQSTYGDVNEVLNGVGLRLPGALDRGEKVYFDQLYKKFGNSWRVKQQESLFDYPAGKTTKNYQDLAFPDQYLKLDMLSPDQIQTAQKACTKAKVSPDLLEGCIFDVGFSGYSEFARATAEVNGYVKIVKQLFPGVKIPMIPTVNQVGSQIIPKIKPRICLPFVGCR